MTENAVFGKDAGQPAAPVARPAVPLSDVRGQVGVDVDLARALHVGALQGLAAQHLAGGPEDLGDDVLVSEAVLEGDRHRVVVEQVSGGLDGLPSGGGLALHDDDVVRPQRGNVRRGDDVLLEGPVPADPGQLEAVFVDGLDVLLPLVDEGDLQAVLGEQASEEAAHGARPQHRYFRHLSPIHEAFCNRVSHSPYLMGEGKVALVLNGLPICSGVVPVVMASIVSALGREEMGVFSRPPQVEATVGGISGP